MADRTWIGGASAVAQVDTFSITDAGGGSETWTWTVTAENGATATATFVDDGTPTTQEIVTGLVSAWNDSQHDFFTGITAADAGDPDITLTADTAGVPFSVTLGASGTGSTSKASTTANKGPNDWDTASNWAEGAVPVADDDVRITGSTNITYGLDQSSVELDDFVVAPGCSAQVGSESADLQIDMGDSNRFEFHGTGQAWINVGSAAISPIVFRTASVSNGQSGLYLDGSAIATLTVEGGLVELVDGSTTTTVIVRNGGTVRIPNGATITTLHNQGGVSCELRGASTTVNNVGGSLVIEGSDAITTLNIDGGTVVSNTTGTITTANVDAGELDLTQSGESRTITTLNNRGGTTRYDPGVVTLTNVPAANGVLTIKGG